MNGELFLCATPIGNLEDITLRVLRILKEVDLIAAEDTRNTIKLLNHFEIKTPMTSYHEHNKKEKGSYLVAKMLKGQKIALVTDAGTPAISDPGEDLVALCYAHRIPVTSLPGPSACITALTISGLPTRRFAFEAFLPADKKERQQVLEQLKNEYRTIVLYEAPHRMEKTLAQLFDVLGDRQASLVRELTKKHETVERSSLSELLTQVKKGAVKGECVLVIEGKDLSEELVREEEAWNRMDLYEHMQLYEEQGIDRKSAMKMVARDRGTTKREIYQALLQPKEKNGNG